MKKMSRSPDRHTFRRDAGNTDNLSAEQATDKWLSKQANYEEAIERDTLRENNPDWIRDNMEYDLRTSDWMIEKVRNSDTYAQHLYAAMCNNDFVKNEVINILQDKRWSCSWRYAGGIIAHMKGSGDYIDWYSSGAASPETGFITEGEITDEIRADLLKLGWIARTNNGLE